MLYRLIGIILIFDGILSMEFVWDKRILWQVGRMIRIGLGVVLIIL